MNADSTIPNEIEKLIGKTFMFQLKLNLTTIIGRKDENYIQLKRCLTTFQMTKRQ